MAVLVLAALFSLAFAGVSGQTFPGTLQVKARFKLQFIGAVTFDITERVYDGWTIYLNFTEPTTNVQIWDADLISCDAQNMRYVFGNTQINADLPAGSRLHIMIMGNVNQSASLDASCILTQEPPRVAIGEMDESANETTYDYAQAMQLSVLFYEIQRSGRLPPARNIPWRYDSALLDMSEHGEDLTGGYYDAGDHLKFSLTIAYAMGVLSWGYITFPDAYDGHDLTQPFLQTIKWGTDYLMKCHTEREEFVYQVGDAGLDHKYWGRPEDMTMERPTYHITSEDEEQYGTEPPAAAAAALAAASIVFKNYDQMYATTMVAHARELYDLGNNYRANYVSNGYYQSTFYGDELCYAAIWLYKATGDEIYLEDAKQHFEEFGLRGNGFSFAWGDVRAGCQLLLYLATEDITYYDAFTSFMDKWLPGGGMPYTDNGLVFRHEWGSLRHAAGVSWLATVAVKEGIRVGAYSRFAKSQMHYILGDTGRSFLIGFGKNYPLRPHHRSSSCPEPPEECTSGNAFKNPGPNPHICFGALVGGPTDLKDTYGDNRENYYENEVALDYDAGFLSALAGLEHFKLIGEPF